MSFITLLYPFFIILSLVLPRFIGNAFWHTAFRSLTVQSQKAPVCLVIIWVRFVTVKACLWSEGRHEKLVCQLSGNVFQLESVFSEPGRGARQIDRDNEWERGLSIPNSGFVRVIGPCIREGPPAFNCSTDIYYCTATSIISKGLGFGIRAGSEIKKRGRGRNT